MSDTAPSKACAIRYHNLQSNWLVCSSSNSLKISLKQLFKAKNLESIPTDRPVVVLCKSDFRAAVAGTTLRHVGFDDVHILNITFRL